MAQDDDVFATWRVLLSSKAAASAGRALTISKKPSLTKIALTTRALPVPVSAKSLKPQQEYIATPSNDLASRCQS
jgi:hypothetical protein